MTLKECIDRHGWQRTYVLLAGTKRVKFRPFRFSDDGKAVVSRRNRNGKHESWPIDMEGWSVAEIKPKVIRQKVKVRGRYKKLHELTPVTLFGRQLQRRLLELNWSQMDLCRRTGINRETIHTLLKLPHSPRYETLLRILDATQTDLSYFRSEPERRVNG